MGLSFFEGASIGQSPSGNSGGAGGGALTDGSVTTDKLADEAVTAAKIADSIITTDKLADEAVTAAKVADSIITTDKLADEAVTAAKIADSIVTIDRGSSDPVFHGIIPQISNMEFPGYTLVNSTTGMTAGQVFWNATGRTLYVIHKSEDTHLTDLFHPDFEVEIHKDNSNFVRGVFESVASLGGQTNVTAALFRTEDLTITGTVSTGDTVELRGHKSVITKTDHILPVNMGLDHGAAEAGKIVTMNSVGNGFDTTTIEEFPTAARIPSTEPDKTETFTVSASGDPAAGQIVINSNNVKAQASTIPHNTKLSTIVNEAEVNDKFLLIVKDSNNYLAIKPRTISTGTGVRMITEHVSARVQKGTISTNDTVRIWVRPENAGKHVVHNFLGDAVVLHSENPHLIYARQGAGIGSGDITAGTGWTWIESATTAAWKIPTGFKVGGHMEISSNGVANFGSGPAKPIALEMRIQHKGATTVGGLSGASWHNLTTNTDMDGRFFRSKISSGGASGDVFRDYWAFASKPMPMSVMHSDAADGRFVIFKVGVRRVNGGNEPIGSLYGFDLTVRVWPASMVTVA